MNTSRLVLTAVTIAVIPAFVSMGCNKKEDEAPAPSATTPAPPPPPATPPPASATEAPKPVAAVARPVAKGDGGVAKGDAAVVLLSLPDAGKIAFPTTIPTMPTIAASALPGIASGIVGGVIGAIPTNLIPVKPAASK